MTFLTLHDLPARLRFPILETLLRLLGLEPLPLNMSWTTEPNVIYVVEQFWPDCVSFPAEFFDQPQRAGDHRDLHHQDHLGHPGNQVRVPPYPSPDLCHLVQAGRGLVVNTFASLPRGCGFKPCCHQIFMLPVNIISSASTPPRKGNQRICKATKGINELRLV